MEEKKFRVRCIDIPIWKHSVFFITGDRKKFIAWLERKGVFDEMSDKPELRDEVSNPYLTGVCICSKTVHLVYVEDAERIAVFSHECFHLVMRVLNYKGLTVGWDAEEAYAYLIEYLTEQYLKKMLNYK